MTESLFVGLQAAVFPHASIQMEVFPGGAPFLEPAAVRVDGLAFLGLSMSRNHAADQPLSMVASETRQTQFDFNQLLDRSYVSATAFLPLPWHFFCVSAVLIACFLRPSAEEALI